MTRIADTGLIVAFLDQDDDAHAWAVEAFRKHSPFHVCDAVLVEAASFCQTPELVLSLVAREDLIIDAAFVLSAELSEVQALATKYTDRPMDLADACIVRMTELHPRCRVWTVDRADFSTYRRNGRDPIPCEFPR